MIEDPAKQARNTWALHAGPFPTITHDEDIMAAARGNKIHAGAMNEAVCQAPERISRSFRDGIAGYSFSEVRFRCRMELGQIPDVTANFFVQYKLLKPGCNLKSKLSQVDTHEQIAVPLEFS